MLERFHRPANWLTLNIIVWGPGADTPNLPSLCNTRGGWMQPFTSSGGDQATAPPDCGCSAEGSMLFHAFSALCLSRHLHSCGYSHSPFEQNIAVSRGLQPMNNCLTSHLSESRTSGVEGMVSPYVRGNT